jgi:hypothetical protein
MNSSFRMNHSGSQVYEVWEICITRTFGLSGFRVFGGSILSIQPRPRTTASRAPKRKQARVWREPSCVWQVAGLVWRGVLLHCSSVAGQPTLNSQHHQPPTISHPIHQSTNPGERTIQAGPRGAEEHAVNYVQLYLWYRHRWGTSSTIENKPSTGTGCKLGRS